MSLFIGAEEMFAQNAMQMSVHDLKERSEKIRLLQI
jgi:hypothetical protein